MRTRAALIGLLACGCYVGLEDARDDTTASSGEDPTDPPAESEGGEDEIGHCDPTAVGSSMLRRLNRTTKVLNCSARGIQILRLFPRSLGIIQGFRP